MKKYLLFFAAAVIGLASCSNDETVEVKKSDAISFRALTNGATRTANAAGVKSAFESGDIINVYADYNSGKYFQDNFTSNGSTFSSVSNYYWPSDIATKNITFTAIWGATQKANTPGNIDNYSPDATAANQKDILVAKHVSATKESPVVMNFRHALSQIFVKVKNTNPNLKVTITGVRIGYIKTASTLFAYSGAVTDANELGTANNASNVAQSDWTLVDFATPGSGETYANNYKYDQTLTSTPLIGNASDEAHDFVGGFTPWILLPQDMKAFDVDGSSNKLYANAKAGGTAADAPDLSGSYIALQMQIENYNGSAATGTIVSTQWCYWPITTNWTPGYKYTYTINVAGGGYMPTDTNNDKILDPVLEGAVITFDAVNCKIDAWDPQAVDVSGGI